MLTEDVSLADALAEIDRPKAHLYPPRDQTLATRLYGSAWLHRAVPTPLALRLAALRGRLEWHLVPRRRAYALGLTETIRGLPHGAPEAARFARRRLVEDAVCAELQWRPWLDRRMPVEGVQRFAEVRAGGGGGINANAPNGPVIGLERANGAPGVKGDAPGRPGGGGDAHSGGRGPWAGA